MALVEASAEPLNQDRQPPGHTLLQFFSVLLSGTTVK